ncbi:helix-turn-helix domain-containing protein [Streptomyces sp. NBC_01445]|uniref:helix-turn-helix domain-containing protein n=1 Tax=Streptomyces sp. NBC_01445 TaxID=2903869 RepID=UPI002DDA4603|nr:hypothetical protein [Streptomyces sp. NBC_01445]WSE11536.1 hypothetical protein OG574_51100 [Streptomyces sp. NBC_01445]
MLLAHPAALDDDESFQQLLSVVLYAAAPTTAWIAFTLHTLLTTPAYASELVGGSGTIRQAMNETLSGAGRCPVAHYSRGDTRLHGVPVPAGTPVLVSYAAAAQDPHRPGPGGPHDRSHLAWSAGAHSCPARSLAMSLAEAAVESAVDTLWDLTTLTPYIAGKYGFTNQCPVHLGVLFSSRGQEVESPNLPQRNTQGHDKVTLSTSLRGLKGTPPHMFDIRQLEQLPEYGLKLYTDRLGDREVHTVQLLSESDWIGRSVENALIVTSSNFLDDYERFFRTLAAGRAAGVVVTDAPVEASMHTLHHSALRYGLPLLTSRHGLPQWKSGLAAQVGELSVAAARQHSARRGMLLDRFCAAPADVPARIAELIATEFDADVVISARGQILACAPPAAAVTLGLVLQNPDRRQQTTPGGHFARIEPLAATPDGVLAVAQRDPFTPGARDLIAHAANALGKTLTSSGAHHADGEAQALTQIRLAVFQMLMTGHTTDAQRVMAGVEAGLLDSDEARIVITDCAQAPRDTVLAEMEKHLDGWALSVRCPAYPQHIISVLPVQPGRKDSCERVRQLLESFQNSRVSAGGSLPHPLRDIAAAYGEALDALLHAAQRAEPMVVTATRTPALAEILPAAPARAWASNLLRPILTMQGGQEVLHSLGVALEFKTTAAARIIGVHRNTLHRRISKAFAGIGCRPDRTLDRVVVSLALQIIGAHGPDLSGQHTATLHDVLSGQAVSAWAAKFLRPLAADPKDLLHTLRTWVLTEFDPDAAGAQLHVSGRTVRWRVQEAEPLMEKDLITGWPASDEDPGEQRLSGIRPLAIALYATTPPGAARPPLPDPTTRLSMAFGTLS